MYGCNKERAHNEKTDCSCHGIGTGIGHIVLCLQGVVTGIDIFRPQTIGGKWTISFDNGDTYEHAKCVYWGTTDDTSVWELMDGSTVIQSGTMHAVQEKQGL